MKNLLLLLLLVSWNYSMTFAGFLNKKAPEEPAAAPQEAEAEEEEPLPEGLTAATWDDAVEGKVVFIKFYMPWCGHCKKMRPDWEKLMEDFADSTSILVAEVNCQGPGAPLCEKNGISKYPTLMHGDPHELQKYPGDYQFDNMKKFAEELKPTCGYSNIHLCTGARKAELEKFNNMSLEELDDLVTKSREGMKFAKLMHDVAIGKLKEQYQITQAAVEATGYSIAQTVKKYREMEKPKKKVEAIEQASDESTEEVKKESTEEAKEEVKEETKEEPQAETAEEPPAETAEEPPAETAEEPQVETAEEPQAES